MRDAVELNVGVCEAVRVRELVSDGVCVPVDERVCDCDAVAEQLAVWLGVGSVDCVWLPVDEDDGVEDDDIDGDSVIDGVPDALTVPDSDADPDVDALDDCDADADPEDVSL